MNQPSPPAAPPLARRVLLAYGVPGLPLAAVLLPLYVYLPAYYAEEMGLGLTLVGVVLLVARFSDILTDPVVGALSDRFGFGLGRRRGWMLAGTPVLLLSAHMLFQPSTGIGAPYLLLWTALAYFGATMILLPYSAWGAELSTDYDQRSRIAGAREGFVVIGTLCAAGLPALWSAERGEALAVIDLALWCVLPVCVVLAVTLVPEHPPQSRQRTLGWKRGLGILYRNGPFRRLLVAYLINSIANGLPATLFLLFVAHVLESPDWSGPLLLVYFACGVLAIPLWLKVSRRHGKHRTWIAAMLATTLAFMFVPLLGPGDHVWFMVICVLTGIGLGADLTLPASMQADVIDLDTLKSGRERAGVYFAAWGMATKLALALAVGIAFPLLDLAGFDADAAEHTDTSLFALAGLYSLAPSLFKLAAIALFVGYPITAARQQRIQRLIIARRGRA